MDEKPTMIKYRGVQSIFLRGILISGFISFAIMAVHLNMPPPADSYEEYIPNAPPAYLKPKLRNVEPETMQGNFCTIYRVDKELVAPDFSCTDLKGVTRTAHICIHPPWLDKIVSKKVFETGGFEPELTLPFQYILSADKDMSLIDIGANIGVYTLYAAMLGRKVVAVEPLYDNMARLHKAIKLNGYEAQITLVMDAISDSRSVVNLTRNMKENNYGHTFIWEESQNISGVDFMALQEVDTIYLDDFLEVIDFGKAILKIAIEGQEIRAFRHAHQLFSMVDIPYVFMEWKWIRTLKEVEFLKDFLYSRGYRPYSRAIGGKELSGDSKKWPFNVIWIRKATKLPKNIEAAYSSSNADGWL